MAGDSQEISFLIFRKLVKMSQKLSSAAAVVGPLRNKYFFSVPVVV